jgi:hypothetical protein
MGDSVPSLRAGERAVVLLPVEASDFVLSCSGITTVTFYRGDADAAEAFLRQRVAEVVRLNPWLTGRLLWAGDARSERLRRVRLAFSSEEPLPPSAVLQVDSAPGADAMPYTDLCRALARFILPRGFDCVGSAEQPLFRVTLLRTGVSVFGLVFSLSHAIADGATYYSLYAMLGQGGAEPRALCAERKSVLEYEAAANALTGGTFYEWRTWMFSPGTLLNIVGTLALGAAPRPISAAVPSDWLARQKAAAAGADGPGSFVSSNDIVTSALARLAGYDVLLMAANMRGKLDMLDSSDAGNYDTLVSFLPEDVASPSAIRRALTKRLHRCSGRPLPGLCASLRAVPAGITNWATFYSSLCLPGAELLRHQPFANLADPVPFDFWVLFAPRAGELEIVGNTRNPRVTPASLHALWGGEAGPREGGAGLSAGLLAGAHGIGRE